MSVRNYDESNPTSIELYAKRLIGHTFQEVIDESTHSSKLDFSIESDYGVELANEQNQTNQFGDYGNVKRKGGLGNLIEEVYFGYKANSESEPDFPLAGVELKVTPFEIKQDGRFVAGERLVLSMIDFNSPIEDSLYKSHLWRKSKLLLLVYYWRNKELESNLQYLIKYVSLFTPTKTDLAIIEGDFQTIAGKIRLGKAEELSESDTFYLGACTKGATAMKSIVPQFYSPHTPARKRAFCYKNSYMTFVLNQYILSKVETYEPLVKSESDLEGKSFTEFILEKINIYRGKTDKQLCKVFHREYNNNKAQWTDLAYRMLGIKSNKAEEFRKANITVKVIRLEESGKMIESMSFPAFRYREIIEETWEDSTLHNYFDETKFLFIVFMRHENSYVLEGCQLWNMPNIDLNITVMMGWQKVVDTIKNGVRLKLKKNKNGVVVENNLPKKSDNKIIHVRPHAQKRYYEFMDGRIIGDGSRSDANQLPDGTWMPNYSFWINNDYILSQLDNRLLRKQ